MSGCLPGGLKNFSFCFFFDILGVVAYPVYFSFSIGSIMLGGMKHRLTFTKPRKASYKNQIKG